jgi:hypothetical protein
MGVRHQWFGNHTISLLLAITNRKSFCRKFVSGKDRGDKNMNGMAIMENIRRYRTIASLYRQTAAFRPLHSRSLLEQAREWEHRAVAELEAYYDAFCDAASGNNPTHCAA